MAQDNSEADNVGMAGSQIFPEEFFFGICQSRKVTNTPL